MIVKPLHESLDASKKKLRREIPERPGARAVAPARRLPVVPEPRVVVLGRRLLILLLVVYC